jgi:hypothetical protein
MGAADELAPTFTTKPVLKQEDGGNKLVFESTLKVMLLLLLLIAVVVVVYIFRPGKCLLQCIFSQARVIISRREVAPL